MKKYMIANWKMHGRTEILQDYLLDLNKITWPETVQVVVCPPAVYISVLARLSETIAIGGQDCAPATTDGAFTGDISAAMLHDAGGRFVIVGHSERRTLHLETNAKVAEKAAAAHKAGLMAVVCIGETLTQRQEGQTLAVLQEQLTESLPASATSENTVIAYEPVWAIGTGQAATPQDVAEVHEFIKRHYPSLPVVYGGSVNTQNAAELLKIPGVDGALIGKASMDVESFSSIINSLV